MVRLFQGEKKTLEENSERKEEPQNYVNSFITCTFLNMITSLNHGQLVAHTAYMGTYTELWFEIPKEREYLEN